MEYIYITGKKGNEWSEEYFTKKEAINAANYEWDHMCEADKKSIDYAYILKSVNPDEDAPDHFDGDIIKIYKNNN